jgi:hypothetical protein
MTHGMEVLQINSLSNGSYINRCLDFISVTNDILSC